MVYLRLPECPQICECCWSGVTQQVSPAVHVAPPGRHPPPLDPDELDEDEDEEDEEDDDEDDDEEVDGLSQLFGTAAITPSDVSEHDVTSKVAELPPWGSQIGGIVLLFEQLLTFFGEGEPL